VPEKNELRDDVIACIWENTNLTGARSMKIADKILSVVRDRVNKYFDISSCVLSCKRSCDDSTYKTCVEYIQDNVLRELGGR